MGFDALKKNKERYSFDDLIAVMKALRDPDHGCPWDLEQSFETIVPHTIEEAYEVADAIDRRDMAHLKEELGDLLFQPVYHAQMADEEQFFNIYDVIHHVTAKMIHRHPHVFGEDDAAGASDVNVIWDQQKDKEGKHGAKGVLEDVPMALPALLRAQKLQKRAARQGFEWKNLSDVLDKLEEEIQELRDAIAAKDLGNQQEELGDILFVLANFARMQGINAEEALRSTNAKFIRRFNGMIEDLQGGQNDDPQASLEEMLAAWNAQKAKENR